MSGLQLPCGGFTLIEMTLVALVIAILAIAAVPRLTHTAQRLRAEGAAFELMQWLRLAHQRAVAEGATVTWVWDAEAHRAALEPDGPRTPSMPPGVEVAVLRDGRPVDCRCVRFFPSGVGDPATITVGPYTIAVDGATSRTHLTGVPAR